VAGEADSSAADEVVLTTRGDSHQWTTHCVPACVWCVCVETLATNRRNCMETVVGATQAIDYAAGSFEHPLAYPERRGWAGQGLQRFKLTLSISSSDFFRVVCM